ncbi:MAG: hypothetical protein FJ121_03780 [Deltaproteobacteria bacterium]|nr:hypothetical protein [Deltaproteobacteria bacterium]
MPGKDFLALMLQVGFHRAGLIRYTGFKSSPYTEGALLYGEKLVPGQARDDVASQAEPAPALLKEPTCEPGGT